MKVAFWLWIVFQYCQVHNDHVDGWLYSQWTCDFWTLNCQNMRRWNAFSQNTWFSFDESALCRQPQFYWVITMEVQKTGNHLFFRASGRETTLFALGNYCRATKIIPTWRHGRRTIEALKKIKILNIWKSLKESSKLVRMFRSKITCIDAKLIWIHQVEVAGVLEKKGRNWMVVSERRRFTKFSTGGFFPASRITFLTFFQCSSELLFIAWDFVLLALEITLLLFEDDVVFGKRSGDQGSVDISDDGDEEGLNVVLADLICIWCSSYQSSELRLEVSLV